MSDTPRTDAKRSGVSHFMGDWVNANFACQLECELNAANAIIRQQQLLDEENLRLQDRIERLEKWIACLNPIAQHSGQSENREWHGVDIRWLYPSQVVYLGEAKP